MAIIVSSISYAYPRFFETKLTEDKEVVLFRPFAARYKYNLHGNYREENYLLYPLGREYRQKDHLYWSTLLGLFNYELRETDRRLQEGAFYPFYFFKKGFSKEADYAAIWPLGGTVKNFLGRDQSDWFLWPLWVKTKNNGTINYWFPWPFLNKCTGNADGFGFWPLGGHFFQKDVYDKRYVLWPLFYHHVYFQDNAIKKGFLPFYAYECSPNIKDLSIFWPIWGHRWEKTPRYEEYRILWPLWVQGRGVERNVNRWAPFYTHSENKRLKHEKTWYLWPLIKHQRWEEHGVDIQQEQFMYFIFWHQEQKDCKTKKFLARKTHFWPFYSYWENNQGCKQLQMLSPFEVFFQGNKVVQDVYTPLFSLYRYNENSYGVEQSFLFNMFREKRTMNDEVTMNFSFLLDYKNTQQEKSISLLKGLFEYKKINNEKSLKLFWMRLKKNQTSKKDCKVL